MNNVYTHFLANVKIHVMLISYLNTFRFLDILEVQSLDTIPHLSLDVTPYMF